jgi:hypothetical protein
MPDGAPALHPKAMSLACQVCGAFPAGQPVGANPTLCEVHRREALRHIPHTRLQALMRLTEPPMWFQAATYLAKQGEINAAELWTILRTGGDTKEDDELLRAHQKAHPEEWPRG